jgi:hypothetical protein
LLQTLLPAEETKVFEKTKQLGTNLKFFFCCLRYEQVLVEEAAAEQTCEQAKADIESALGSCSSD